MGGSGRGEGPFHPPFGHPEAHVGIVYEQGYVKSQFPEDSAAATSRSPGQ